VLRLACGRGLPPMGGPSRPGGSIDDSGRGGAEVGVAGVVGADAASVGTKFERTRIGGFFGGPSVRSMAVAGRIGGVPGIGGATWDFNTEEPGEAV
jgi:hypothetical protein